MAHGGGGSLEGIQQAIKSLAELWRNLTPPVTPYRVHAYYTGGADVLVAATPEKIKLNTKEYDANNNFDAVTNYRYTVPVSGYYLVTAGIRGNAGIGAAHRDLCMLYKNGAEVARLDDVTQVAGGIMSAAGSKVVKVLVSDYLELWGYSGVGNQYDQGAHQTYMTIDYLGT